MRKIFPIILATLTISSLFFGVVYSFLSGQTLQEIKKTEISSTTHLGDLVDVELSHIVSDLKSIKHHHELQEFIAKPSEEVLNDILVDWQVIQEARKIYDQIRYIDSEGQERIRVNYTNGKSVPAPTDQLQNKAHRYYFEQSISPEDSYIYISELDLNMENGEIERPFKPMIRFGSTIFDDKHSIKGVVVLNVLADVIFEQITQKIALFSKGDAMVVNKEGYWLLHSQPDKTWGFMLGHNKRFDLTYPSVWGTLKKTPSGQVLADAGLFTYVTISPFTTKDNGSPTWTLLSFVSREKIDHALIPIKSALLGVWLLLNIMAYIVTYIFMAAKDAKARSVKAIENRERMINLLLNSTEEGIYGVDSDGNCTFFNKSAERLLGYTEKELLGKNIHDFFAIKANGLSPDRNNSCCVENVSSSGSSCHCDDAILLKKGGQELNVSYHIHPIIYGTAVQGAVVTFTDITEKKKLIAQRIRSGQLSSLGELAAGIAHEINNPIHGVINYAEVLLNRNPRSEQERHILKNIVKEGVRVADIVKNLLKYVHKDSSAMGVVSLADVVEDATELLHMQLKNDGVTLRVDIADGLPRIYGNHQKLVQIILNLITNSRHALNDKFSGVDADKQLAITAKPIGSKDKIRVLLTVWDNGTGMTALQREKAFNRFYTTKAAGVGTGLGLSIVHDIVEEHHAVIAINSEHGSFTEVSIEFPVFIETS